MQYQKITIVTVSYNAESCIEDTIKSVLSQDYMNLEYIIVDGDSKDDTVQIIKKYIKNDYNDHELKFKNKITRFISESDKGLYFAMNKAIELATGEWINYMNCGDSFTSPTAISDMFNDINNFNNLRIIYGDTICYKDNHEEYVKGWPIKRISRHQPFAHQSAFFSTLNKNDIRFDTNRYKIACDYDVTCRIYKRYGERSFLYLSHPIAKYCINDGVSIRQYKKSHLEYYKIKMRNRLGLLMILRDSFWLIFYPFGYIR